MIHRQKLRQPVVKQSRTSLVLIDLLDEDGCSSCSPTFLRTASMLLNHSSLTRSTSLREIQYPMYLDNDEGLQSIQCICLKMCMQ